MKMLVAFVFALQLAYAEDSVIWTANRSRLGNNTAVSAVFSADVETGLALVKVYLKQTSYVSPRNIPVIRKKTVSVPLEGLYMQGNDLMFDNTLCGSVRMTTGPGPRNNIFSRKLLLTGNCQLKVVKTISDGEKVMQVIFGLK